MRSNPLRSPNPMYEVSNEKGSIGDLGSSARNHACLWRLARLGKALARPTCQPIQRCRKAGGGEASHIERRRGNRQGVGDQTKSDDASAHELGCALARSHGGAEGERSEVTGTSRSSGSGRIKRAIGGSAAETPKSDEERDTGLAVSSTAEHQWPGLGGQRRIQRDVWATNRVQVRKRRPRGLRC